MRLGLVNRAEAPDAEPQIRLVNNIRQNTSWFGELPEELAPAMVLVNWRF